MKTTKWFKVGEKVPPNAKFLMKENKIVGYEDGGHDLMPQVPVYAEFLLYEVDAVSITKNESKQRINS